MHGSNLSNSHGLWSRTPENLRLFIGGVPSSLSDQKIISYFKGFGSVSKFMRMLTKQKQESGCGILEIRTCFKQELVRQPHKIKSFLLNCQLAVTLENMNQKKSEELQRKVFVSNLPRDTSDAVFYQIFSPLAKIEKAFVVRSHIDGSQKNFGFVIFASIAEMNKVISLNQPIRFRKRKLNIVVARERDTGEAQPFLTEKLSTVETSNRGTTNHPPPSPIKEALLLSASLDSSMENYRFNRPFESRSYTYSRCQLLDKSEYQLL